MIELDIERYREIDIYIERERDRERQLFSYYCLSPVYMLFFSRSAVVNIDDLETELSISNREAKYIHTYYCTTCLEIFTHLS